MNEMIKNLGERMVVKMRVINTYTRNWATDERRFTESRKHNKFDYEFSGMTQALRAMGLPFEIEYDDDVTQMTAITIMGNRFETLDR